MPTYKFSWSGKRGDLERASAALSELLDPPADAVSLTKDDAALADDDATWTLDAYFAEPSDENALDTLLQDIDGLGEPARETLEDIDWVAHALEGLGIVRAGRFVLYGAHDADRLERGADDVPIRIDANQAFGTGHHPTTAGCLTLLSRLAGIAPARALDLGAGSAVLAIAAAKVWRETSILAADIDAKSVEIARENLALNGIDRVPVVEADGFAHAEIARAAPFDFVFANILAGPLADLAPAMGEHVEAGGRVMLAGLMAEQEEKVARAYEAVGFRALNRLAHDTWPVLLFIRR